PRLHLARDLPLRRGQIHQRYLVRPHQPVVSAFAVACGVIVSSRPPARIDRSIASSARTTAVASGPPTSGRLRVRTQSRKWSHSALGGAPAEIFGMVMSPSRMLARNDAKVSTTAGGSSATRLS